MDTQEKILHSALKIFVEQGFSATTSSITKDAGVSTGILFHYFSTKNDLILALYSDILLEYYQVTSELFRSYTEYDLDKFRNIAILSWKSNVNWSLDNWPKFQYIQLFESSLLANQFKIEENKNINELFILIENFSMIGIKFGIIRDQQPSYNTEISRAVINATIKFLHNHPQFRYDTDFLERAEQIHWNLFAK
jgi:AcrR family transcriptional regulator